MVQHLSIRVPWHDGEWNGTVCAHPEFNHTCRILKNIALGKSDKKECLCAGQPFIIKDGYQPPCLLEGAAFMSEKDIDAKHIIHPYTYDNNFKHIDETPYRVKNHSLTAKPYSWTLRENARKYSEHKIYNIKYDDKIELNVGSGNWVSNGINQKSIFDYFYQNIVPNESIAVVYAKSVPFIEKNGRIIIGIGIIAEVEELKEYKYKPEFNGNGITSFLWERQISHSIRHNKENGFLFPFKEIEKYLRDNPEQAPEELVVMSPDGYFHEFSYATEHLSHDALILTLNKTISVLYKYRQIGLPHKGGKSWDDCISWCKEKLEIVWKQRGMWPGLGSVLQATGIDYGHDIALSIREKISDDEIWDKLPDVLAHLQDYLPENMKNIRLTKTQYLTWKMMNYDIRLNILKLLSKINLSLDQAKVILDRNNIFGNKGKPHYSDFLSDIKQTKNDEILDNPYILYEKTRLFEDKYRFGIGQIDVAMFPSAIINAKNVFDEPDDERRLRAIIVSALENAAQNGSTLMTDIDIVNYVNLFGSDIELDFNISTLTLIALEECFKKEFTKNEISEKSKNVADDNKNTIKAEKGGNINAFQLNRFGGNDSINNKINEFIKSRIDDNYDIEDDWPEYLTAVLGNDQDNEHEKASREEKLKAVKKMSKSKLSVLTGGAGTGKTSTLAALCLSPEIQEGGIIILAPTGKARVVLDATLRKANVTSQKAYTVFQFLRKSYHCDRNTYRYYLSGRINHEAANATVIIDECSMLTEEMFAALIEAISTAKRVIFVGDPNQLPPIGAGKPFFELTEYLEEHAPKRHAKLLISNRQKTSTGDRLDVELSKMFTYDRADESGNDIFTRLSKDATNIEFVKFNNEADLYRKIIKTISIVTDMKNEDDLLGFDKSLGGTILDGCVKFPKAEYINRWQILSPYRNDSTTGSITINQYIHDKYRPNDKNDPLRYYTKKLLGNDGIVYGDKVINVKNQEKHGYPEDEAINYVANGEIGIVKWITNDSHELMFASQPNTTYYFPSKVSDNESDLELSYALTVHKAQGSGFNVAIFIINEPESGYNSFISREMIYTALTRQSDKIYILYNKDPVDLRKYADCYRSDLARRLTNLFSEPTLEKFKERYYAGNLIHITRTGEPVRSKSEVVIYNELDNAKVSFKYEELLVLPDGKQYSPDFTIYKKDGSEIYWEHLGRLSDYDYRKRWEAKEKNYNRFGISESNANLIITKDERNGAIDSFHIKDIIYKLKDVL
jgi:DNA-binding Xre family transcriptional regulator